MQFDLVCDYAWLQPLSNSAYMAGMFVGASLLGDLADRIGRKKGILVTTTVMIIGGLLSAVSINYYMFMFMKFVTGVGGVTLFAIPFILSKLILSNKNKVF